MDEPLEQHNEPENKLAGFRFNGKLAFAMSTALAIAIALIVGVYFLGIVASGWVPLANAPAETRDHLGRTVRIGSRVKILSLSDDLLNSLPDDELAQVREMLGNVFEVDEVKGGRALVIKPWDLGSWPDRIGLSPSEIRVVDDAG